MSEVQNDHNGYALTNGNSKQILLKEETKIRSRVRSIDSNDYSREKIFDKKVLNGKTHPTVSTFFDLSNEQVIKRYKQINPNVNVDVIKSLLCYQPSYFYWAGSDLMKVSNDDGQQKMIIVETNSCPSGSKYMTFEYDKNEFGAYGTVIERTFKRMVEKKTDKNLGGLAVVCDKNEIGTLGYAMTIAKIMCERVWLIEWYDKETDVPVRWNNGVLYVRDQDHAWYPIRAVFRYLTQKPWNRFPIHSKTLVINNVLACLCGGRNKMMASYAYDFLNRELFGSGLQICIPDTLCNISKMNIPKLIHEMNNKAVIKVPYSNAGQGVYTITCEEDLQAFMELEHHYDKFIIQSLVGNIGWNKKSINTANQTRFYHVGMVPNRKNHIYVYDLRIIITSAEEGFRPVAIYARRARTPLIEDLNESSYGSSWEMLGTNLSYKFDGKWKSEVSRLLVMDIDDFNQLGIGLNDLIEGYIQTVLSVIAIDKMCHRIAPKGLFDMKLFKSFNPDAALLEEILVGES